MRMAASGIATPADYVDRLKADTDESRLLLEALSVGVTRFFRDPDVFDEIARSIVPGLVGLAAEETRPIRLWIPGCASGEEAYSLAMLFLEATGSKTPEPRVFATDIDEVALDTARKGVYPQSIERDVPEDIRRRYLERSNGRYRVGSRLRAICQFSCKDLNDSIPVAHLDMISCRYVLTNLKPSARQRILMRFYEILRPGGVLILGPTEDVEGADDLFEPHEKRCGIYRALPAAGHADTAPDEDTDDSREPATPVSVERETRSQMSLAEQLELRNAELERLNRDLGFQIDQLETTMSLVPVGIAICEDSQCKAIRVNRAGGELLGVPENSDISARADADSDGPPFAIQSLEDPDVPAELPIRQALTNGEAVVDQPLRVVRRDGSSVDILASAVPLLDENRRARGAIAAFVDNTGQAEERRRLTARHAADRAVSRLGIDMLSEHDIDTVVEVALAALVRELDVELAAVFEYRPNEDDLILRTGTGWQSLESDESTLELGLDTFGKSTFVIPHLQKERRFSVPSWIREHGIVSGMLTAVPRPGEPFGALGVFSRSKRSFSEVEKDFFETVATLLAAALERDHMERMLVETRDRLSLADAKQAAERAEQLAALGTLAAGISHEINNPLNSILVNAELGLMKLDSGHGAERIRPVLESIVEDVRRCARITESVLNLAKENDILKSAADLNDIVLRARELVASHLQLHDASIELDLGDLPELRLDANAMESAMVNLMRNAAESGRLGVAVSIRTRLESGAVTVEVSDDGPGIAPEHIDHVFDPFYSTKRADKGTGLGLSLVHNTITDHGGTIGVTSRVGEGTTFEIRLPVSDETKVSNDKAAAG